MWHKSHILIVYLAPNTLFESNRLQQDRLEKRLYSRYSYTDSSGVIFFLTAAPEVSSFSLSLSAAWAFFSSSEKLWLLTFWAPRPPFFEANYKQTHLMNAQVQHQIKQMMEEWKRRLYSESPRLRTSFYKKQQRSAICRGDVASLIQACKAGQCDCLSICLNFNLI